MDKEIKNDEKLNQAFLDAYRNIEDLEMMVEFKLCINLYDIVSKQSDRKYIVFELIKWSLSNGIIKDLIKGAYEYKQGNENLKQYYEVLFPFSRPSNTSISEGNIISLENILLHIDFEILHEISKLTLRGQTEDIAGQIPEIFELKNIAKITKVLLEKYPLRKRDKIPTVLEFTQRLYDCGRLSRKTKSILSKWLHEIANEKNINLPIKYKKNKPNIKKAVDSYLFIIANEIEIDNKFNLSAELIPRYQPDKFEIIPLELSKEQHQVCQLEEIGDVIGKFVECARKKLIIDFKYTKHNLIIELFLPYEYLRESIDLQKILASGSRQKPIGQEYYFAIRCSNRYLLDYFSNYGDFLNNLYQKWDTLQENFETKFSQVKINSNLICVDCINQNHDWDTLLEEWEESNIVSVNLSGSLPTDGREQNFFLYLLIGGIPLSLWNRSSELIGTKVEEEFLILLNWAVLNNPIELHQKIRKKRRQAHLQRDNAVNFIGYHLGFLLDNPNLVPKIFDVNNGGEPLLSSEY